METEFDPTKIFRIRKLIQNKVPEYPTSEDYTRVEPEIKKKLAHEFWKRAGQPVGRDVEFWLEAEKVWNFCRYMWVDTGGIKEK